MKAMQSNQKWLLAAVAAVALSACSPGTRVKPDGTTEQPVWPKWDSVNFDNKRGTFPNLGSLKEVKAGMTKDQLYYLLGRPHYGEAWRPKEWNYLFHFHTPGQGTNDVSTCQFKVLFDKDRLTRSFYWHAVDPQNGVCPPAAPATAAPVPAVAPAPQRYTLSADALFPFARGDLANAQGSQQLRDLAAKLKALDSLNAVNVVGHTDYLGSDAYNLRLSQQRAEAVRQYLIGQGLPANIVHARGMGEREPVKQCGRMASRAALIACLQPNRRVEIQVDGFGEIR